MSLPVRVSFVIVRRMLLLMHAKGTIKNP